MKFRTLCMVFVNVNAFTNIETNYHLRTNKLHSIPETENVFIPDIEKRALMNQILITSLYGSCGPLIAGFGYYFYPAVGSKSGSGVVAKDKNGEDVIEKNWLFEHKYPSRALVQGLKGDAHYLITSKNGGLERYALNAVCTHLGCVVPWNPTENKFMCPCHGSQYNNEGKVIRGPAPKSLAMAAVENIDGKVYLKQWVGDDFRTNEYPWWL